MARSKTVNLGKALVKETEIVRHYEDISLERNKVNEDLLSRSSLLRLKEMKIMHAQTAWLSRRLSGMKSSKPSRKGCELLGMRWSIGKGIW